jgi:hypothetical protein
MSYLHVSVRPLHNLFVKGPKGVAELPPNYDAMAFILGYVMFKVVETVEYCLPSVIISDDLKTVNVESRDKTMISSPVWEGKVSTKHFQRIACAQHSIPVYR